MRYVTVIMAVLASLFVFFAQNANAMPLSGAAAVESATDYSLVQPVYCEAEAQDEICGDDKFLACKIPETPGTADCSCESCSELAPDEPGIACRCPTGTCCRPCPSCPRCCNR